jgi:hypothetical protein
MKKKMFIIFLTGLIFYVRYLFLITVMGEERVVVNEPLRVVGAKIENGELKPVYIPSNEENFKKIGPFEFLIRSGIKDPHPVVKVRFKNKEYPFLYLPYIGPLQALIIPKIWYKTAGTTLYSFRLLFLFTFLIFVYIYGVENSFQAAFFLLTFPIFGMTFATPFLWNQPVSFLIIVILIRRLKDIMNGNAKRWDSFLLPFLWSFLLHIHLLANGALLFSMIMGFLLTKSTFRLKSGFPLFLGILSSLIFLLPFVSAPFAGITEIIFRRVDRPHQLFLRPIYSIIYYIFSLFASPSYLEVFFHDRIAPEYLFLSIPSGCIMGLGFFGLASKFKKEKFEKFLFITVLTYFFITSFGDIRPYHINYVLPLVVPFIKDGFKKIKKGISENTLKTIFFFGIFLNFIQIEMMRDSINGSSFSLSLHRQVCNYLVKNRIKKIHNIAGTYSCVLISKEKIEMVDFLPLIGYDHPRDKIYISLLLSRGEVILLESYKRYGITTGISLEEVLYIAREAGLKINVLKKFPDEGRYELVLAKVE